MYKNNLINQKSPYLLQHAHNPVNWYPWCNEAFEKAKSENKPIFLSVGYSTCHWCHVMEQESFEDLEVAQLLNTNFISIKVDKEERPDIDTVYMHVCQALTGSGGWPMTIIMTPDKKPFFAGTYFPKHSKYGSIGVVELLNQVANMWQSDKTQLEKISTEITDAVNSLEHKKTATPTKDLITSALTLYRQIFDSTNGGFGGAPKFPTPHNILFLLKYYQTEKNETALKMADKTLTQMAKGGIFDHIGGGFSRYSTDEKWLVPHFEKMLYDNGLLSYTYLEGYKATKNPFYKYIATRTLDYVLTNLTHKDGGFFCGEDADSEGVEGKFYVFTPKEVYAVLGQEKGKIFCEFFDITPEGNFESKNIPNILNAKDISARPHNIQQMVKQMYDYRGTRTKPHTDHKILTSWNGIMISALSKAYRVLEDKKYLTAAKKAVNFIKSNLMTADGSLYLRYCDGEAANEGQLDDYAYLSWAFLEMYNAEFDAQYLKDAITVAKKMVDLFFDNQSGGFYIYSNHGEQLISRPKEIYDGAMPSGNSVAALVLVRLSKLTAQGEWQALADKQLEFLAGNINEYLVGHSFALIAVLEMLYSRGELVCTLPSTSISTQLVSAIESTNINTIVKTPQNTNILSPIAPFTDSYPLSKTEESYYLCHNGACMPPVHSIEDLKNIM